MRRATTIVSWLVAAVLTCTSGAQDNLMRVHFIDVGQGDATLIEFPHGVMLVDAGGEAAREFDGAAALMRYLENFFERRDDLGDRDYPIDLLAITHPHLDHTRAIPQILQDYTPANIIHNHGTSGTGSEQQIMAMEWIRQTEVNGYYIVADRAVERGGVSNDVIDPFGAVSEDAPDPKVTILWGGVRRQQGWERDDFRNQNNHSLVIRVDFGDSSILFTGDLEEGAQNQFGDTSDAGIERVVHAYRSTEKLNVDVYQAGHHGSRNGGSDELMRLISPEIAVISCGPPLRRRGTDFNAFNFGHPRKETIDEMEREVSTDRPVPKDVLYFRRQFRPIDKRIHKSIYCTGWDGTIVLEGTTDGEWSVAELHGNPGFEAAMRIRR